jgi:hypothetical protein
LKIKQLPDESIQTEYVGEQENEHHEDEVNRENRIDGLDAFTKSDVELLEDFNVEASVTDMLAPPKSFASCVSVKPKIFKRLIEKFVSSRPQQIFVQRLKSAFQYRCSADELRDIKIAVHELVDADW